MFEYLIPPALSENKVPIEFTYRGRRLRIYSVLKRWRESGLWWQREDFKDGAKEVWRVEAAPIGAITTFEISKDENTGQWSIRII